jgi:prolipoprotein diacylglyceryltransferase
MSGKIDMIIEGAFAAVIVIAFILFIYSRIKKITMSQALDNAIILLTGGKLNGRKE